MFLPLFSDVRHSLSFPVSDAVSLHCDHPCEPKSDSVSDNWTRHDGYGDTHVPNGLNGAARISASMAVATGMQSLSLPSDASEQLATIPMPQLVSLKLPFLSSPRHAIAMISLCSQLRTLHLRWHNVSSCDDNSPQREHVTIALLNRMFAHCYSESLQQLNLTNFGYHDFSCLHFDLLTSLTHLSLTQIHPHPAITIRLLHAIGVLPRLVNFALSVGSYALVACADADWWTSLLAIAQLSSFEVWWPRADQECESEVAVAIKAGIARMMGAAHSRVTVLRLRLGAYIDDDVITSIAMSRTLHTLSMYDSHLTVATLPIFASVRLFPSLTSLGLVGCGGYRFALGFVRTVQSMPRLRSLSYRYPRPPLASLRATFDAALWATITTLRTITALHLIGFDPIDQRNIDEWCRRAREGERCRAMDDERGIATFINNNEQRSITTSVMPSLTRTINNHRIASEVDSITVNGSFPNVTITSSSSPGSIFPSSFSSFSTFLSSPFFPLPLGVDLILTLPLEFLRFTGSTITHAQCRQLLTAMPQLQRMSARLLGGPDVNMPIPRLTILTAEEETFNIERE